MQTVSKEYKEAMKESLRERGYIKVFFGLFNGEAQTSATVASFSPYYFSDKSRVFEQQEYSALADYAMLDENYIRVDGSMYFPPNEQEFKQGMKIDTGLVSSKMVSKSTCDLKINLNTRYPQEFKGMTIEFSDNYPVDFDCITDSGEVVEFRGNDTPHFKTEEVIPETSSITLRFLQMNNQNSHLRIHYIMFGYGLIYTNEEVKNSTLSTYVSPITEDVPQTDFSFTVTNLDQYFNVDNPDSAINFFETGQTMDVMYGEYIKAKDEIEWVHGSTLWCDEWSATDSDATVHCVDRLRLSDSMYNDGVVSPQGTSLWHLARAVFEYDNITDYYIDPYLKNIKTTLPIPRVTTKEALQLIANAGQSTLSFERDGTICIRSNFIPERTISSPDEAYYSNVQNILIDDKKDEYARLDPNYTIADGDMFFAQVDGITTPLHLGFVSKLKSDANGNFTGNQNPRIYIEQEAAERLYGLDIKFGHTLPKEVKIAAYNGNILAETFTVTDITKNMHIDHEFPDLTKLSVTFIGTQEPFNHVVVNYMNFSSISGFTMNKRDMTGSPTTSRTTNIQDVVVTYYTFAQSSEEKKTSVVKQENVSVKAGQVETYYFDNAAYDYSASDSSLFSIVSSGTYKVTVKFLKTGTFSFTVDAWEYDIVEQTVTKNINPEGEEIDWENPLICSKTHAEKVANWLADYYRDVVEYSYSHRGFPELDATDIIEQENEFVDTMYVEPYEMTTTFNGAFGGSIKAKRRDL